MHPERDLIEAAMRSVQNEGLFSPKAQQNPAVAGRAANVAAANNMKLRSTNPHLTSGVGVAPAKPEGIVYAKPEGGPDPAGKVASGTIIKPGDPDYGSEPTIDEPAPPPVAGREATLIAMRKARQAPLVSLGPAKFKSALKRDREQQVASAASRRAMGESKEDEMHKHVKNAASGVRAVLYRPGRRRGGRLTSGDMKRIDHHVDTHFDNYVKGGGQKDNYQAFQDKVYDETEKDH